MAELSTFLMFQGKAEEALNFYVDTIPGSQIDSIQRFGPEGPGAEGTIMLALFQLAGQPMRMTDSPAVHDFDFTPSVSLFFETKEADEFETITATLAEGGSFMMPPDNYGFSTKFAFLVDRFGVSWQINLV